MEEENKKESIVPETELVPEVPVVTTTEAQADVPVHSKHIGKQMWIIIVVLVGSLLIAGAVFYMNSDSDDALRSSKGEHEPEYVLATINGDAVYQKDLDTRLVEMQQQLQSQGVDMTDAGTRAQIESQVVTDLVNYKLLNKGARDVGIEVDATEVDTLVQGYIKQAGGEEAYDAQLKEISLTRDAFRERVTEQLVLQKYLSQNITDVEPTDENIQAYYDNVAAAQEGVPPLTEIKEQIVAQIVAENQQKDVEAFIATLREQSDVIIN